MIEQLLPLLLVLPMAGFLITAFFGRRFGKQAHWIPVGAIFLVWIIAMLAVASVLTGSAPVIPGSEEVAVALAMRRGEQLETQATEAG